MTPLHYDPYINLFHLQASAAPKRFAKHVTLFPPSLSHLLRRESHTTLRNTSPHKFGLCHTPPSPGAFEVYLESKTNEKLVQELSKHTLSCVVREGETLLIPRRWWHRVENVDLMPEMEASKEEKNPGWNVGVCWWFTVRN